MSEQPTRRFDPEPRLRALGEIEAELLEAQRRFAPMASPHEGISVVHEEFDELLKEVRNNKRTPALYRNDMRVEACQLAAMALRFMLDCTEPRLEHQARPIQEDSELAAVDIVDRAYLPVRCFLEEQARAETAERERDEARQEVHGHHRAYLSIEAQRDAARAALAKYGRHLHAGCSSFGPATICTCGLTAALNASPT